MEPIRDENGNIVKLPMPTERTGGGPSGTARLESRAERDERLRQAKVERAAMLDATREDRAKAREERKA